MAPKDDHGDFSESDRAQLDQLLAEREFEKRLAERAQRRKEAVKAMLQWVGVFTVLAPVAKDLSAWLLKIVKHLLDLG